jgi:molybdopterin molybdotransferase
LGAGSVPHIFKYISLDEVISVISGIAMPLEVELVNPRNAVGRFLAEDIVSPQDLPERDISHVDGYAIAECDENVFKVTNKEPLSRCEAIYVRTGEFVAEGAVAVVPVESVRFVGPDLIAVPRRYERFYEVVRKGSDLRRGEVLRRKGDVVTPPTARALIELGIDVVKVYRKPRVLIVPTGTEFVAGSRKESTSVLVKHMCEAVGAETYVAEPLEDSVDVVKDYIGNRTHPYDLVATIGGASLGDKDVVLRAVMELRNSRILFRGVAVQPGRVTTLAVVDGKPITLLPGLLQSTVVGTIFVLQPLLKAMQGSAPRAHSLLGYYRNLSQYEYLGRFTSFTRVRFVELVSEETLEVKIVEVPSSSQAALVRSFGFTILPPGVTSVPQGEYIRVYSAPGLSS